MLHRNLLLALAASAGSVPLAAQGGTFLDSARAHYARAEAELRAHDVSQLDPVQRAAREAVLRELRAYAERGAFGVNDRFPGIWMPFFVDGEGRRCAVAWLLDRTGAHALTSDVAATANHVWVAELAEDGRFARWLARHGLTIEEAARIQFPSDGGSGSGRPRDTARPRDGAPPDAPPPPRWEPEPDMPPTPGGGPSTPRSRPDHPGLPGGGAATTPRPGGPTTGGMPIGAVLADESWSEWWSWNRASFLDAKAAAAGGQVSAPDPAGPLTGTPSAAGTPTAFGPAERLAARQRLREALADADSIVRAGACIALGRLGHPEDVPELLERLDDADRGVRNDAILALGANASPAAVHALSQLALHGHLAAGDDRAPVTHIASPLATLALGLARRRGAHAASDALVRGLATARSGADGDRMRIAALLYADLQDDGGLHEFSRQILADRDLDVAVRCRAVETLDFADAEVRRPILEALAGREVSLRRSAALALGRTDDTLALPSLMTAFELENEQFTRALVLLAIGEHDATDARDFLIEQLREGPKMLRAWAALGLGIWARDRDDTVARVAIRDGWRRERNQDHADAYLLAMGLAEDPDAVDILVEVVRDDGSSMARSIAAEALALCGTDKVKGVLREQLSSDSCPYARSVAAEALGAWRDPADAGRLVAALGDADTPDERIRLANALGRLGGEHAHAAVIEVLDEGQLTARERAAAILALGQILDPRGLERHLPELARTSNYTVFPTWLRAALATAL